MEARVAEQQAEIIRLTAASVPSSTWSVVQTGAESITSSPSGREFHRQVAESQEFQRQLADLHGELRASQEAYKRQVEASSRALGERQVMAGEVEAWVLETEAQAE